MKANANKCQLLVCSDENCIARIEDFIMKNDTEEKLLGVKLNSNLSFENHVTSHCKRQTRNYTLLQEYQITWS